MNRQKVLFSEKHNSSITQPTIQQKSARLLVAGQGTIIAHQKGNLAFSIHITTQLAKTEDCCYAFSLNVDQENATFSYWLDGEETVICKSDSGTGLNREGKCLYWFSLDSTNYRLSYGIGEPRELCTCLSTDLSSSIKSWLKNIQYICVESRQNIEIDILPLPVTEDPPLLVVERSQITLEFLATKKATVIENLTVECQRLYANIAGIELNTPDFPCFSKAIEQSLTNPKGWCHQILSNKKNSNMPTYLRIGMGTNQGESPGCPYVLEIWPSGYFSPIHNHADANAIIKVLHGEITIKLFSTLSTLCQTPFKTFLLKEGEVTWMTPLLNKTHQLHNESTSVCVTIQCYAYPLTTNCHYPYFDYVDNHENCIQHFEPISDIDFLTFQRIIRQEWEMFIHKNITSYL